MGPAGHSQQHKEPLGQGRGTHHLHQCGRTEDKLYRC